MLLIGVRVLIVARADEQPNGPVFQGVQPEQEKEDNSYCCSRSQFPLGNTVARAGSKAEGGAFYTGDLNLVNEGPRSLVASCGH